MAFVAACAADQGADGAGDDDADPIAGPDFPVRYHTRHVDLAPGFTQAVCRGTLEAIDRQVDVVASVLDIDVQARPTVFWFNEHAEGSLADDDESRAWCGGRHGICTHSTGEAVYSNLAAIPHELVHAAVIPAWGRSDVLFEEGLAHGLDGHHVVLPLDSSELPSAIIGGSRHGGAHFTRWLLDRFGSAKLRALFEPRSLDFATRDDVLAAVEDVYGMPLVELEAEYLAMAPTIYPALGLCDGLEHVPRQGNLWELSTTVDCDTARVFGPRDEDAAMELSVTLDLPSLPGVPFTAMVEPSLSGHIAPCIDAPLYDVDDPAAAVAELAVDDDLIIYPAGGRYRLTLPIPVGTDHVRVRICPWNGRHPVAGEDTPDLCLEG